jgi:uncharacterized protein (TIGR02594 family)
MLVASTTLQMIVGMS